MLRHRAHKCESEGTQVVQWQPRCSGLLNLRDVVEHVWAHQLAPKKSLKPNGTSLRCAQHHSRHFTGQQSSLCEPFQSLIEEEFIGRDLDGAREDALGQSKRLAPSVPDRSLQVLKGGVETLSLGKRCCFAIAQKINFSPCEQPAEQTADSGRQS